MIGNNKQQKIPNQRGFTPHHFPRNNSNGSFPSILRRNMKSGGGFTLIELLVSITIFSLLIATIIAVLLSGITMQRKSLAEQEVLNQLSFALEYMGRALRVAVKDDTGACTDIGFNYKNPDGPTDISSIVFINHLQENNCQKFHVEANTLMYTKNAGGVEEKLALTSPDVVIEVLKFELLGESDSESPNLQPRVTIFLQARPENFVLPIKLQTTISQRNLDIP